MKKVLAAVAVLVGLVVFAGIAGFVWVGSAAQARLTQTWPDVKGKDLPIPWPLTEEEIEALRQEKAAELAAAAPPAAEPAKGKKGKKGKQKDEPAPEAPTADPLEGVDLDALARERAVERGAYLARTRLGCAECHGADGAGTLVADAMPVWKWYAPNITSGGATQAYTPADYDRIIRHGIKPNDQSATMPAVDYMGLSDREVSDLAAWIQSLPASSKQQPATEIGPVGKALLAFGKLPISAEEIDHAAPHPELPPEPEVNAEFGQHVAQTCVGCHRLDYSGGPIAAGPPDWPPAANLTPHEDGLKGWSKEDFVTAIREAKRPDGSAIDPVMPTHMLKHMSDTELEAMFVFLQGQPARPTGT